MSLGFYLAGGGRGRHQRDLQRLRRTSSSLSFPGSWRWQCLKRWQCTSMFNGWRIIKSVLIKMYCFEIHGGSCRTRRQRGGPRWVGRKVLSRQMDSRRRRDQPKRFHQRLMKCLLQHPMASLWVWGEQTTWETRLSRPHKSYIATKLIML